MASGKMVTTVTANIQKRKIDGGFYENGNNPYYLLINWLLLLE